MNAAQIAIHQTNGYKTLQQIYDTVRQKITNAYQKVTGQTATEQIKQNEFRSLVETYCPVIAKEEIFSIATPNTITQPKKAIEDKVIEITSAGPLVDSLRQYRTSYYPRERTRSRLPEYHGFFCTAI